MASRRVEWSADALAPKGCEIRYFSYRNLRFSLSRTLKGAFDIVFVGEGTETAATWADVATIIQRKLEEHITSKIGPRGSRFARRRSVRWWDSDQCRWRALLVEPNFARQAGMSPEEQYKSFGNIGADSECWLWRGMTLPNDYGGVIIDADQALGVHRWHYERVKGPLGSEFEVHHVCRNKECTNPKHLEALLREDHIRRHQIRAKRRKRRRN